MNLTGKRFSTLFFLLLVIPSAFAVCYTEEDEHKGASSKSRICTDVQIIDGVKQVKFECRNGNKLYLDIDYTDCHKNSCKGTAVDDPSYIPITQFTSKLQATCYDRDEDEFDGSWVYSAVTAWYEDLEPAQNVEYWGEVFDVCDETPISNVKVYDDFGQIMYTDLDGRYRLRYTEFTEYYYHFEKEGYHSLTMHERERDSYYKKVFLNRVNSCVSLSNNVDHTSQPVFDVFEYVINLFKILFNSVSTGSVLQQPQTNSLGGGDFGEE